MKIYTHNGIEIDDVDLDDLKNNDILYLALDGEHFSNDNYINEYEYDTSIKKGGYAEVYKAKHTLTGKIVAIKKTNLTEFSTEQLYNISREALYLKSLKHKHIIKIYSSYLTENALYIVMKFAKGGELTTILKKEGIEESKVKKYYKQIIKAIRFVHCNNVILRDLKPTNILFLDEKKNKIVIIDFGISGIANGNNSDIIKAGTALYIPPEIIKKNFKSSPKLDIWALGVILYQMIFGKCPFYGKNIQSTLDAILYNSLKFPSHFIVSESLLNLIHGLLKKKPSERIDINSELFDKWFNDKKYIFYLFNNFL
jgi:serine/threonine protein kinase